MLSLTEFFDREDKWTDANPFDEEAYLANLTSSLRQLSDEDVLSVLIRGCGCGCCEISEYRTSAMDEILSRLNERKVENAHRN